MGNTYTVESYVKDEDAKYGYSYKEVWRGESFFGMIWVAFKQKRQGVSSVKMEWK